ncbi:MAG: hypothetical protein JHD16_13880 [Solirubrobacteraceae bacterium]|nr:hypothetical protein [Solirubrobacteraceae bacterium]
MPAALAVLRLQTLVDASINRLMAVLRSRSTARLQLSAGTVDLLLAVLAVTVLGLAVLLTPAFTDYEAEAEPAIQALVRGDLMDGLRLLPIYAGSVLAIAPFGAIAQLLGGGDLAIFRAVAVPGAAGVAVLAGLAGRWLREAGQGRWTQLAGVGALALSPCVAMAWGFGHVEEPLVASVAVGGVIFAARDDDRGALIGGVLLGLAVAGKLWAVVLVPVAIAAAPSRRTAAIVVASAAVAGALLLAPYALTRLDHLTGVAGTTGEIFSRGNFWWFFGAVNPTYAPDALTQQAFTTANSARLPPDFIASYARGLIVGVAVALSAWWAVVDRRVGPQRDAQARLVSILWLAAAVLWWRALLDPWFQPYYLTAALMAVILADARAGRRPVLGLVAWAAFWLLHGRNPADLGLGADGASALSLIWTVPVGILLTRRALNRHA